MAAVGKVWEESAASAASSNNSKYWGSKMR